jgi:UTP:GlnB (protein PII) uridylyltransferase
MTSTPVSDWSDEFSSSMPASYRDRHARDVAAHAAVSQGRGARRANVGRFESTRGGTVVCVVADDRPGLLSRITAAFMVQGWDIVHAEAYTRPVGGAEGTGPMETQAAQRTEAVDLFWLKRADGHGGKAVIADADVEAIRETLIGMLEGRVELPEYVTAEEPGDVHNTRVRFIEGEDGTLCTLEVETRDRSGLLLVLTRALSSQRVTITRSEVRTFSSRVFDRFTISEFDGSPISESRRLAIQVAVLSAIEAPQSVPAYKQPARERRAQAIR